MTDKCDHITNCNKCGNEVCSYCVEDCSGCQLEWCKKCYIEHQKSCSDCLEQICPKEVETIGSLNEGLIPVCPRCNMKNANGI